MKRKRRRLKRKKLTLEQEKKIIEDFDAGIVRNKILQEHEIPEGQFYYIIRETALRS